MEGGYTYNWSGRSDGYHAQAVVSPLIIEVTPVNKHIMRLRMHRSLGVVSLVSVYAVRVPTEASDLTLKDILCRA